jgi:hypothetical protein
VDDPHQDNLVEVAVIGLDLNNNNHGNETQEHHESEDPLDIEIKQLILENRRLSLENRTI